jgi:hypothetical protein
MSFNQIAKLTNNQAVLTQYIELKNQESSDYQVSLKVSSQNDLYLRESGKGILQVYYFVKNFFRQLAAEGLCYFLPRSTAQGEPIIIGILDKQSEAAFQEVENYYDHLAYLSKSPEEIRNEKGADFLQAYRHFLQAHQQWQRKEKPLFGNVRVQLFDRAHQALEKALSTTEALAKALPQSFPGCPESETVKSQLVAKTYAVWASIESKCNELQNVNGSTYSPEFAKKMVEAFELSRRSLL